MSTRPGTRAGSYARWTEPVLTMGRPLKLGGNAWAYLVDAVAGEVGQGADAARYYAGKATPPGRFLGRGLDGLGPSPCSVKEGDVVSAQMLHRMVAQLADPISGQPLGRSPYLGRRAPVAGFDMTFHPSKSVSVMWAMAGQPTRAAIEEVLAQAASEVIAWAEDHVFRTRTGADGARQEAVRGVVASAWLHYESNRGWVIRSFTTMSSVSTGHKPAPTGPGGPWTARPSTHGWSPCRSAMPASSKT